MRKKAMVTLLHALPTWIVLLLLIHTSLAKPLCHSDESFALMEFKRSFHTNANRSNFPKLYFPCFYPKVASWSENGQGDCCSWDGVECAETTGHVIGVDISGSCLVGTMTSNTSLFRLLHLESLNLAGNDFSSSPMPCGFGNLSRLQYLNLSNTHFSGNVPLDIPRLSRLVSLDLSFNWDPKVPLDLSSGWRLEMTNIENFIQNLTVLRELDLSFVSISSPLPHVLANFSSLKLLKLRQCGLHGEFPIDIFQSPNLEVIDISLNENLSGLLPEQQWGFSLKSLIMRGTNFSGQIPISIGNLVFLNELSIADCGFSGSLPTTLGNLSHLALLDIARSRLHVQITTSFANLTQLSYLDLSINTFRGDPWHWLANLGNLQYLVLVDVQLSGSIPSSFENLTRLVLLDVSSNNLQGEIPNSFGNLMHIKYLHLSENKLSGTVDLHKLKDLELLDLSWNNLSGFQNLHELKNLETLVLAFNNISFISKTEINAVLPKLSTLVLDSCNLHEFPEFLGYLSGLMGVSLSHNKIGGSIPSWIWNGSRETLMYIDLSHNSLTGFGDNQINLPLPKLRYLDISSNMLKTALPSPPPSVIYYNTSNNLLFGAIQSICKATSLVVLDLSINNLNGTIPSCLGNIGSLSILSLGRNKLEGMIPDAYLKGCALKIIDLTENQLQGYVPRSLENCTKLEYLNIGYNQILDGFPLWLSGLTEMKVVILKSNRFHGPIETYRSKFKFSNLHIMDLSNNSFCGELPSKLLQSFHAMKVFVGLDRLEYMYTFSGLPPSFYIYAKVPIAMDMQQVVDRFKTIYGMKLMNKGAEREYSKVPYALMEIDLSNNKFEGCIPSSVGELKSLLMLNLSSNILTGSIPPSLANLTNLESLDLSWNNLSGEIPQQLAQLTFLASFDVSHNQLSGPIPRGSQFDTFGARSFAMNKGLCGSPLPNKCTKVGDNLPLPPSLLKEDNGEESPFDLDWKVVLIGGGVGFLIGVVLGNLIIDEKSRWFMHYSKRIARKWKKSGRH